MPKTITARVILAAIIAGAVIALILFGPAACTSLFTAKQEARTAKGQAGASIASGAEATNTMGNVMASDAATDATVKGGRDEILSHPAGNSNDAAVRAACRMRINLNSERCTRLRGAGAVDAPAGGGLRPGS